MKYSGTPANKNIDKSKEPMGKGQFEIEGTLRGEVPKEKQEDFRVRKSLETKRQNGTGKKGSALDRTKTRRTIDVARLPKRNNNFRSLNDS
jgi:hypothetical protein